MKKFLIYCLAFWFCFLANQNSAYAQNRGELPETAQNFISQNFQKNNIKSIERDTFIFESQTIKVTLDKEVDIYFDEKGIWLMVSSNLVAIPDGIVPVKILEYIKKNFPGDHIKMILKEKGEFEIGLQSDLALLFDKNFKFKKID